jgi:hypothetical protein
MSTQPAAGNPVSLQQVIDVLKALPADKLASAYDYLRFLQQQAEMQADDAEWDSQLETGASQRFLGRAATEVRAEITAQSTTPLKDLLDEEDAKDEAGKRKIPH